MSAIAVHPPAQPAAMIALGVVRVGLHLLTVTVMSTAG